MNQPEEDIAKRLLLDENEFLRRKVAELESSIQSHDWHQKDWARIEANTKPIHGEGTHMVQCAINDIQDLDAIRRLLKVPKGSGVLHHVQELLENRDHYKSVVAHDLLSLVEVDLRTLTKAAR